MSSSDEQPRSMGDQLSRPGDPSEDRLEEEVSGVAEPDEGAGRPGPADEVPGTTGSEAAGRPGPADEVTGSPGDEHVAGRPGPSDEVDRSP